MLEKKRKKRRKIIGISIVIILAACIIGFFVYVGDYYRSSESISDTETKFSELTYSQEDNILTISPKTHSSKVRRGVIFYPGAKVEYTSYATLMSLLAKEGVTCFIVKMPFNFAIFEVDAASDIIEKNQNIEEWYMAGHSLGGAMAASYAYDHVSGIEGLILLAAYGTDDFSGKDLDIISIYGSNDYVIDKDKIMSEFDVNVIQSGNHAGFGTYGPQDGDGQLGISPEKQRELTVGFIREFIIKDDK